MLPLELYVRSHLALFLCPRESNSETFASVFFRGTTCHCGSFLVLLTHLFIEVSLQSVTNLTNILTKWDVVELGRNSLLERLANAVGLWTLAFDLVDVLHGQDRWIRCREAGALWKWHETRSHSVLQANALIAWLTVTSSTFG